MEGDKIDLEGGGEGERKWKRRTEEWRKKVTEQGTERGGGGGSGIVVRQKRDEEEEKERADAHITSCLAFLAAAPLSAARTRVMQGTVAVRFQCNDSHVITWILFRILQLLMMLAEFQLTEDFKCYCLPYIARLFACFLEVTNAKLSQKFLVCARLTLFHYP